MNTASLPALFAAAVCFAGCGQKGPLVLPDVQHPHKKVSVPKQSAAPAREPAGAPATPAAPVTPLPADDAGNSPAAPAPPQ